MQFRGILVAISVSTALHALGACTSGADVVGEGYGCESHQCAPGLYCDEQDGFICRRARSPASSPLPSDRPAADAGAAGDGAADADAATSAPDASDGGGG